MLPRMMNAQWECIEVQVKNNVDEWQKIDAIAPRAYWSMEAVNLSQYANPDEDLLVRLYWKEHHHIDYVGLDTTQQETFSVYNSNPSIAIHSVEGNVKWKLMASDNIYAELTPGQHITLVFTLPNTSNEKRTFIFHTEGHYYTIT